MKIKVKAIKGYKTMTVVNNKVLNYLKKLTKNPKFKFKS